MIRFWTVPEINSLKRSVLFLIPIFIIILALPVNVGAESGGAMRVCIPPFANEGLHPKQIEFLEKAFYDEIAKDSKYLVIPYAEVKAMAVKMNEPDPEVRKSNEYYFYMADQLDADLVFAVSIQKAPKKNYVILVQVLDAFDKKSLEIFIQESDSSKKGFLSNFSILAQRITGIEKDEILVPFLTQLNAELVFCSNRDGDWDIYRLQADERYPESISANLSTDFYPSWSPDGQKLVYSSRRNRNYEIVVVDMRNDEERLITHNRVPDVTPDWGETGNFLTFCSLRNDKYEIILYDLLSGSEKRLTSGGEDKFFPHLVDRDNGIMYSSGTPSQLFEMTIENGAVRKLLDDGGPNFNPVLSPDGSKIAFESTRDGNYEIYLMNRDGTALRNITKNQADDLSPTFSPDGNWLAFSSDREGNNEIYVMNLSSKYLKNITQNPKDDRLPAWSPVAAGKTP